MNNSRFTALYESTKKAISESAISDQQHYVWVQYDKSGQYFPHHVYTDYDLAVEEMEELKDSGHNVSIGEPFSDDRGPVDSPTNESSDDLRDNLTESEESFKVKLETFMDWYHGPDWETNVESLNDVTVNGVPAQDNKFSGTDILEELVFNKTREVFIKASKTDDGYSALMVAGLNEFEFICGDDPMHSIGQELSEETLTEDDEESDFPKKFKVTKDIFLSDGWRTKDDEYGNYGEIKAGSILDLVRIKQVGPQEYITLAGIYTIDGTEVTAVFRAFEPAFPEAREILEEAGTLTESVDLDTLSDKQIDSKLFKLMKKNNIEEKEL